ncbi:putative colanic acid biosynthesis acetyltransferase [Mucilaginibacter lappiensis]|uniref:Colanic acid biosynthesis acetyltransferase WcaF n=1 Tax=Mucilaginibacter lappiensis TaxID=354630 RepID=A0A1N7CA03_9SPHI|nr:putative colanic acid biosynthesis acetyltransferase [Mucilaginibacter lappiensis]MBB6110926.1 putative colanic acid biosynthesis acetyltransferase WcaF [Mucilaginibacter lappiensis]MBB6128031.1 putative colanic acid biosynthesis acetyltransferase WcaF [Mucilaginibacter lappiensis]SIR60406.1 putative colanic acid biosynthesis acetyltransferase WcaF [Mucilaginibacter lappiensis]
MHKTDLSTYNNYPFHPGGNAVKRLLWFYVNALFFKTSLVPVSGFKVFLLRVFGAKVGKNVTIKPCVNIKYPWHLNIGDESWIGEKVWIDSLITISIGAHVCLSQGAVLLTGSHDYKKKSFNLITKPLIIEDGAWIGAGAIVNQGITIASHAVLTSGSVATRNLEAYSVYQGNPAVKIRDRIITHQP